MDLRKYFLFLPLLKYQIDYDIMFLFCPALAVTQQLNVEIILRLIAPLLIFQ